MRTKKKRKKTRARLIARLRCDREKKETMVEEEEEEMEEERNEPEEKRSTGEKASN